MGITVQERERIREEEATRWLVRQELRWQKRPQLLVIGTLWTLALTTMAVVFSYYRL